MNRRELLGALASLPFVGFLFNEKQILKGSIGRVAYLDGNGETQCWFYTRAESIEEFARLGIYDCGHFGTDCIIRIDLPSNHNIAQYRFINDGWYCSSGKLHRWLQGKKLELDYASYDEDKAVRERYSDWDLKGGFYHRDATGQLFYRRPSDGDSVIAIELEGGGSRPVGFLSGYAVA